MSAEKEARKKRGYKAERGCENRSVHLSEEPPHSCAQVDITQYGSTVYGMAMGCPAYTIHKFSLSFSIQSDL